jgi:hypothetical protein
MRRRTGLPHRILIDEAHYFLHDAGARHLLDFEWNGYTVVTYRASGLPPDLVAATEVMLVTCESNPVEVDALRQRCAGCGGIEPAEWSAITRLPLGQAIALLESGRQFVPADLAGRNILLQAGTLEITANNALDRKHLGTACERSTAAQFL